MNKPIKTDRLTVLSALLLILLCVYFVFLYKLQIIEGDAYLEKSANSLSSIEQVTAARGNILDRYGRVLVSNQPSYNITINEHQLFYETDDPNAQILALTAMMKLVKSVNKESTLSVTGTVRERDSKNPKLPTGDIEVVPEKIEVLGRCRYNELPFEINRSREADEAARLKYRYLDLRNPAVKKNIILRCNVVAALRQAMAVSQAVTDLPVLQPLVGMGEAAAALMKPCFISHLPAILIYFPSPQTQKGSRRNTAKWRPGWPRSWRSPG